MTYAGGTAQRRQPSQRRCSSSNAFTLDRLAGSAVTARTRPRINVRQAFFVSPSGNGALGGLRSGSGCVTAQPRAKASACQSKSLSNIPPPQISPRETLPTLLGSIVKLAGYPRCLRKRFLTSRDTSNSPRARARAWASSAASPPDVFASRLHHLRQRFLRFRPSESIKPSVSRFANLSITGIDTSGRDRFASIRWISAANRNRKLTCYSCAVPNHIAAQAGAVAG